MVLWAVLTPIVLFLMLVPGYVVATYLRHRLHKDKPGKQLLNNDRVASYSATSRLTVRERLQERSSLIVPSPVKPITKHLKSASIVSPCLPATKSIVVQQPPWHEHFRRNSSPTSILVTPQHRPDILETFSPYQVSSCVTSLDEKSPPEETPLKTGSTDSGDKKSFDSNNNGNGNKNGRRSRHLIHNSPSHFYATTGVSPFIIPMKMEPVRELMKIDMPERVNKP